MAFSSTWKARRKQRRRTLRGTSVIVSYKDGYARRGSKSSGRSLLVSLFLWGNWGVKGLQGLFVFPLVSVFFRSCLFWSRCFRSLCHALRIFVNSFFWKKFIRMVYIFFRALKNLVFSRFSAEKLIYWKMILSNPF